jgi:hypothetical protein
LERVSCLCSSEYHAVLARKASRLTSAHELAVLGRCALALRRTRESLRLVDSIREICLIIAHDRTSAYLRWISICHHGRELP